MIIIELENLASNSNKLQIKKNNKHPDDVSLDLIITAWDTIENEYIVTIRADELLDTIKFIMV